MTLSYAPLPPSWSPLAPRRQLALGAELVVEIGHPHPLYGVRFVPAAECDVCSAVLLELDDGRQALVRPTFSGARHRPPSPRTDVYGGPAAGAAAVRAHAAAHVAPHW